MDVISFLQIKNRYLKRYLDVTLQFLDDAQEGQFGGLTAFERQRDSIISALDHFDQKISETISKLPSNERSEALISVVKANLRERDALIQQIVTADDFIIHALENEKIRLTSESFRARKNKSVLEKFKSGWVNEPGDGLDETL